jgi:hypothetical protein
MERRKRPGVAAVLSGLVWPGAGQLYNGQRAKGWTFIVLSTAAAAVFVVAGVAAALELYSQGLSAMGPEEAQRAIDQIVAARGATLGLSFLAMTAVWLLSIADAWWVARRS